MRKFLFILLLILLMLPAVRDLFRGGAYTSHDLTDHIVRTIHMDKILKEGQFPPRWTGDLNWGWGYPLFLFNYPLPSMIASGIHNLGISFIWSVKLTFAASVIFSGIFAFVFFRSLFRNDLSGLVGALFYVYAPIRFVNLYVSATFGNAVAFAFVPLVFWAILKAKRREFDRLALLGGSVSLAGIILSHNIMALMFLPLVFGFFAILLLVKFDKKFLIDGLLVLVLGLGIAGFFLIPAFFEKSLIRYDDILRGFYKAHFPTFGQLMHSHWGYGFSFPGAELDDMSFQIGLAQIMVFLLAVFAVFFRFLRSKRVEIVPIYFLAAFVVAVFFMLEVSDFIWSRFMFVQYMQMPWRLLAVTTFCSAVLASYLVGLTGFFKPFAAFFLIAAVLIANRNHLRINQQLDVTDDFYMVKNDTTTMASEHLPKNEGKYDDFGVAKGKISVVAGEVSTAFRKNTSGEVVADLGVVKTARIRFNQVYFAGWKYYLDGRETDPQFDNVGHHLPQFTIGDGLHTFRAYFARTPVRFFGDFVSVVSIIGLGIMLIFFDRWKNLSGSFSSKK